MVDHLLALVNEFPDWVSIGSFYSALHFVEAYFAQCGLHFEHHEERNQYVSTLLSEISSDYLRLYDYSVSSRYCSIQEQPTPADARELATTQLQNTEDHVMSLLVRE